MKPSLAAEALFAFGFQKRPGSHFSVMPCKTRFLLSLSPEDLDYEKQ